MTKRRAAGLFGTMTILLMAYATWCCRDFILRPSLAIEESLPDDMMRGISACYHKADPFPPSRITLTRFVQAISNPYENSRSRAVVIPFGDTFVGIETSRGERCYLHFEDGQWCVDRIQR